LALLCLARTRRFLARAVAGTRIAIIATTRHRAHLWPRSAFSSRRMRIVISGGAYAVFSPIWRSRRSKTYTWLRPGEMLAGLGQGPHHTGPLDHGRHSSVSHGSSRAIRGRCRRCWTVTVAVCPPLPPGLLFAVPFCGSARRAFHRTIANNKPNAPALDSPLAVVGLLLNLRSGSPLHTWFRENRPRCTLGFAFRVPGVLAIINKPLGGRPVGPRRDPSFPLQAADPDLVGAPPPEWAFLYAVGRVTRESWHLMPWL